MQLDENTPNSVVVRPAAAAAGSEARWFREKATGITGTTLPQDWFNDILGNIRALWAAVGITRTKGASGDSDLTDAIRLLCWQTGDQKLTLKAVADPGWVMMDDGTIGDSGSGGTTRANADCEALFTLLWNNIIDTWCPVSGGRGGSAAADWAAGKTITLPLTLGRALAVSGAGAGLTARALGENLGDETHNHGGVTVGLTGTANTDTTDPTQRPSVTHTHGINTDNHMQPTSFLNVMIKL